MFPAFGVQVYLAHEELGVYKIVQTVFVLTPEFEGSLKLQLNLCFTCIVHNGISRTYMFGMILCCLHLI